MANKLYRIEMKMEAGQIPLFFPFGLVGNEVVLCVEEAKAFAQVFYGGRVYTIAKEYLAVWVS